MLELFDQFLAEYDFVLVDSPPILPVVDPALIGKLVGGMLIVVSAGRTRKNALSHALKSLETSEAPVAGFALNMVSSAEVRQYGRGYGYGYHGYGYGKKRPKADSAAARRAAEPSEQP